MAISEGETPMDLARMHVLEAFEFGDKRTKKSLDEIFESRGITNPYMMGLVRLSADLMVKQRFMRTTKECDRYVFSRDPEGKYFWGDATLPDRILNYLLN